MTQQKIINELNNVKHLYLTSPIIFQKKIINNLSKIKDEYIINIKNKINEYKKKENELNENIIQLIFISCIFLIIIIIKIFSKK